MQSNRKVAAPFTAPLLPTNYAVALEVAKAAAYAGGRAAMRHYGTADHQIKAGGSPVTAADHASNEAIQFVIGKRFPNDAILSEETHDSAARLHAVRLWIVDPLDGTKEFIAGIDEFSIMVALLEGGALKVGAVYLPANDSLFYAVAGGGAYVTRSGETVKIKVAEAADLLRAAGSRSHTDPVAVQVYDEMNATIKPSGSVGVKCALIAEGRCDVYVHPVPYMSEWDTAAPELILREAGGVVTDCTGAPLRYNKPDTRQPHGILAGNPSAYLRALPLLQRRLGNI